MHRKILTSFFLATLFLFDLVVGAHPSFAQVGNTGTELTMVISPAYPRPGEEVTVSIESYNFDLNRSEVHWFVNDRPVKTAVGYKKLVVRAGRNGETTIVRVAAIAENGNTYSKDTVIRPAEVNLLWQAQSYTPPFYRGKALMPFQGTVMVTAVPTFAQGRSTMAPESLIYTWKEGDDVIGGSSGKGKNLFPFRGAVPMRPKTISVLVESPDRTMSAEASITVDPVSPRLLFYENHPRYGLLLQKALGSTFSLEEDEARIDAVPYYFETSGTRGSKDMVYEWQMNYTPLESSKDPFIILRRTSDAPGRTSLFLEARSSDDKRAFQATDANLMIEFPLKGFQFDPTLTR